MAITKVNFKKMTSKDICTVFEKKANQVTAFVSKGSLHRRRDKNRTFDFVNNERNNLWMQKQFIIAEGKGVPFYFDMPTNDNYWLEYDSEKRATPPPEAEIKETKEPKVIKETTTKTTTKTEESKKVAPKPKGLFNLDADDNISDLVITAADVKPSNIEYLQKVAKVATDMRKAETERFNLEIKQANYIPVKEIIQKLHIFFEQQLNKANVMLGNDVNTICQDFGIKDPTTKVRIKSMLTKTLNLSTKQALAELIKVVEREQKEQKEKFVK